MIFLHPIPLVLTLTSDMVYIYSSFLEKVFILQKTCCKIKLLKTLKNSGDYHIKKCRSLKWRAILKVRSTTLVEPMLFLLALK